MRYVVEAVMFVVACILVAMFEHADLGITLSIWHSVTLVIIVYVVARLASFAARTVSRRT